MFLSEIIQFSLPGPAGNPSYGLCSRGRFCVDGLRMRATPWPSSRHRRLSFVATVFVVLAGAIPTPGSTAASGSATAANTLLSLSYGATKATVGVDRAVSVLAVYFCGVCPEVVPCQGGTCQLLEKQRSR